MASYVNRRVVLAAAAGAALHPGATLVGDARAQERPIRIGMSVSSTGAFALASQSGERGARVWVDEVNRRGGLLHGGRRRPVELVTRDDRSDRQLVVRVYEALINEDRVDALIAPMGSTLTGAAAPITERHGKFMVSWSGASDALYEQGYRYVVSGVAPTSRQSNSTLDAFKAAGGRSLAIIYSDEPFPVLLHGFAKAHAERIGLRLVLDEKYPRGNRDFGVLLQRAQAANAEMLFMINYEPEIISILRQAKEMNVSFPAIWTNYSTNPAIMQLGSDADFLWGVGYFDERARWRVSRGLSAAEFAPAYRRLFPNVAQEPDFQTALAYGVGVLFEIFAESAPTLSGADLKAAALAASGSVTVIQGPFRIAESGLEVGMSVLAMQNQRLRPEIVGPADTATAAAVYPMPAWDRR